MTPSQTRIISFNDRFSMTMPVRRSRQPFLDALEMAKYGRLQLITPEGHKREFVGSEEGPSAQLKLYDWEALDEFIARGEIGFAETYVRGLWGSDNLANFLIFGLANAPSLEKFFYGKPLHVLTSRLRAWLQDNSIIGSRRNVIAHYDLGNDFYGLWLDEGMTYSCALFEGDRNRTLEEAQTAKYRRILRKLAASKDEHILEIGCGWGGFAEAAARAGLRVTSITLSHKQMYYAADRLRHAGLQGQASIALADYREIDGQYDHIVSIGMFEHVGERYWPTYFQTLHDRLKPSGRAIVQTITLDDELFEKLHGRTGFIEQMIFPGGMLPSRKRFRGHAQQAGLACKEMYVFGQDYVRTLEHWLERFNLNKEAVKALGYDEAFLRLWRFYLCSCIAAFTSRRTDVMQAELVRSS